LKLFVLLSPWFTAESYNTHQNVIEAGVPTNEDYDSKVIL